MAASLPSDLIDRPLGDIAVNLPGSTSVFRRLKLDFCCGGRTTLADAAAKAGLDVGSVANELAALNPEDSPLPEDSDALIDHILERYHAVHRRELPELIRLALKVEQTHAHHPQVPTGLASLLHAVLTDMESHQDKEEQVLFPMMRRGSHPMIGQPISVMRHEHDTHGDNLRKLEHLTDDFTPPEGACGSWCALYAGLRKFADDLVTHIHLENNILFPRFESQVVC